MTLLIIWKLLRVKLALSYVILLLLFDWGRIWAISFKPIFKAEYHYLFQNQKSGSCDEPEVYWTIVEEGERSKEGLEEKGCLTHHNRVRERWIV